MCFIVKAHWLKTDFDKWRDEDDSDVEEGQDMQLEEVSHLHVSTQGWWYTTSLSLSLYNIDGRH